MNNYISSFMLLLFCVSGVVNLQAEDTYILGSQWAKNISEAYQQGQFSDFFNRLETRYAEGLKNKEWDDLRNEGKKLHNELETEEGKKRFKELKENSNNYANELQILRNERNSLLLKIAKENPDHFVSKVISDLQILQKDTSNELNQDETIANDDSTQLNEIYFKMRVFQALLSWATVAENADLFGLEKISLEDSEKYHYVIGLYEFQMLKQAEDREAIKNEIMEELAKYSLLVANNHNESYLQELGNGTRKAENNAEKCVAEIMKNFQERQKELIKKHHLGFQVIN